MKILCSTLLWILCALSLPLQAQEKDSSGKGGVTINIFPERQKERRQSRWTLSNWMETKKEIAEQNRWLWAHTHKIPMELALGYTQSPNRWHSEVDFYVARLGLHLEYGKRVAWFEDSGLLDGPNEQRTEAAAQIRLFGGNLQDTHLIARVGYEHNSFSNSGNLAGNFGTWYAEPELQIYFAQWLGVRGNLKYRWQGSHLIRKNQKWSGTNHEALGFLELGALRLEGGYRWLRWDVDNVSPLKSEELIASIKIFF